MFTILNIFVPAYRCIHTRVFVSLSRYDGLVAKRVANCQCFVYSNNCIEETQWCANEIQRELYACSFPWNSIEKWNSRLFATTVFCTRAIVTSAGDWCGERSILDEKNRRSYLVTLCNVEIYFILRIKSVLSDLVSECTEFGGGDKNDIK